MGWYQRRSTWGLNIQSSYSSVMLVLLLLPCLLPLAWCAHGYGHPPAPELLCRDTNTSIYAEVCVPAFAEQVTPVTLAVKEVVDADYCFDRVLTICEETTQVTYEEKSETMKVTTCSPVEKGYGGGYGYQHANQHCREEYQTQAYKVPPVTAPLEVSCSLAYPAPKEVCVTKDITITEVKCEDKVENKCFSVAEFIDATNTVDQKEIIVGDPSCEEITLTLDTQACQQKHGYHPY